MGETDPNAEVPPGGEEAEVQANPMTLVGSTIPADELEQLSAGIVAAL